MGVRFLYSYMMNDVPNGVISVDITQEAREYRKKYGRDPTIIIDLLAMRSIIYTSDHEICLGGRYNVYNERSYEIFSKLKSLGIKLIFFTDGPSQTEKFATCLERRNSNYNNSFKILQYIDSGGDLSVKTGFEFPHLMPFVKDFRFITSEFGDVHVATLNECDLEMANLANKIEAMAIISNDTDFLIYEGNWHLWSSKDLDIKNLRTFEFNRRALRTHLSLDSNYMSLLATLAGNDILKYDYVRNFHWNISRNRDKFRAIADVIKSLRSYPCLKKEDVEYFAKLIFPLTEQDEGIKLIKQSLKSYSYNGMTVRNPESPVSVSDLVSEKLCGLNRVIVENIIDLFYFDLTDKQFSSFYEIVFPFIRRQMGILLYNTSGENVRTFYYKKSHETEYAPYELRPEYPKCKVPPLTELYLVPYGTNSNLDNLRLELVCWQISEKLHPNLLLSITDKMMMHVLTLFYLYEKKIISLEEADCLLLSVNCPPDIRNNLKCEDVQVINGRDARIAFLFCRIYSFINYNTFTTVGLTIFDSLLTFDGLYYHHIRKYWTEKEDDFMAALQPLKKLRIYSEDFNIIEV